VTDHMRFKSWVPKKQNETWTTLFNQINFVKFVN